LQNKRGDLSAEELLKPLRGGGVNSLGGSGTLAIIQKREKAKGRVIRNLKSEWGGKRRHLRSIRGGKCELL